MKNETTLTEKINEVLYNLDPMGTCCLENELKDEYLDLAEVLESHIGNNFSISKAIDLVFDGNFWTGAVQGETKENLEHAIAELIA